MGKNKTQCFSRFSTSQVHMDFSRVYTHFRDQRIRLWIVGINATTFKGKIATPAARISLATFERIPQKVFEGCFWGGKSCGNLMRSMTENKAFSDFVFRSQECSAKTKSQRPTITKECTSTSDHSSMIIM